MIWTSIVMGLTMLVMSLFPFIKKMGTEMAALMKSMPEGLSKAMSLNADTWSNILGGYNTYYGIYIIVIIGIYTTSTGATILSKEERDRTAEFLLTKPLSRKAIFTTKMMSLFTLVFAIQLLQTLAAIIGILIFGEGEADWRIFATMQFHGLVLVFFFTCIGVLIPVYVGSKNNFMGMAVGLVFGAFFLSAIAKAAEGLDWIGYATPFGYLGFEIFEPGYGVAWGAVVFFVVVGVLLLVLALRKFERLDIGA
ncbi:MAG: ABC-2 type transport system permease protein [Polaribacter sp.]|jgi:ABC-2 type transport system permease protein